MVGAAVALAGLIQLLGSGVPAEHLASATILVAGVCFTVLLFLRVIEEEDRAFMARAVLAGLLLRVGLTLLVHFRLPVEALAPDQFTFQDVGWRTLLHLEGRGPRPWQIDGTYEVGYFYWNALVFKAFGFTPLAPKLINAFLGAWTGLLAYRLGGEVGGRAGARGAALLTLLMPSMVLWSTQNLREAAVTFLNGALLLSMVRLHVRPRVRTLGLTLLALTLLAFLRDYLAWMAALALVGSLVMASGRGTLSRLVIAGTILILWVAAYRNLGFGADLVQTANFESIDAQRRALAFGGTAFAPEVDISTPVRGLLFLPVGVAFFLLAPFPWQVTSSPLAALAFPETIVWYGLLIWAAVGLVHLIRHRFSRVIPLLVFVAVTVAVYGLVEGNAGTAYRHRSQLVMSILVFAAVGFELKRLRRAPRG